MTNRLADETSPYLLQHKDNPVDWYPWGDEALSRARNEDKPILVSVGYSSCHWCHVMEHESFSDQVTADLMNDRFVCIKVDREERPDIDSIYMTAVQVMGQRGGWPLNMFLLPDMTPFFGGTYWPPLDRQGMPGFRRVLTAISDTYRNRHEDVLANATQLRDYLTRASRVTPDPADVDDDILVRAIDQLVQRADLERGGWGPAPKFPQPMILDVAMARYKQHPDPALDAALTTTLTRMADGGMYDQIGGGFHRYSVDADWLVPHFEKMLYDNAQLLSTYLDAWLLFRDPRFREIADQTATYILREMTDAAGGFYSATDADSDGEEGTFFVWTPEEIRSGLSPEAADRVIALYAVTPEGNFDGRSILNRPRSLEAVAAELGIAPSELQATVQQAAPLLVATRQRRNPPFRDEKVIASWNGLMLHALARAAGVLRRPELLAAARANGTFLTREMLVDEHLRRSWKTGVARGNGFLEDYAAVANGLISLYEATFEPRWLREAISLTDSALGRFADPDSGVFYDTASDHEQLLVRPRELQDGATPSGNALLTDALLRLAHLTEREDYRRHAVGILRAMSAPLQEAPLGFGRMLGAANRYLSTEREIVLGGDRSSPDFTALFDEMASHYEPLAIRAYADPDDNELTALLPLTANRTANGDRPTAYVCHDHTCSLPVTTSAELHQLLAG